MPKVFLPQPLTYDFRLHERAHLSLRQNGSHKIITKEQQKRTSAEREHFLPCKGRYNKAKQFYQKQKRRFGRSGCSETITADHINLPPDWHYPEYKNLERIKLEQKEIEFRRLKVQDVQVQKKKAFFLTETPSSISNELNKSNTNHFPIKKWKRWEMNNKSLDISEISTVKWDYIKASMAVLATFKPVKSLLNDWLQIPEYKIPIEQDISQMKANEAETKNHEIDALAKRKEIFSSFLKSRDAKIEAIDNDILKDKALNLDCKDIQDQSLYGSTQALPGLIEDASDAFSNSEGIDPQEAKDHLALIGVMMSPNPLVIVNKDADRIYQLMRENGTEAYYWLQKGFKQDMQIKKDVGGKIHYSRTKSRLKYLSKVARMIWYEIQPKIKNGTLNCRYPDWKEEIYSGIYSSALSEIELMQKNRSVNQKLNKVQAPEQDFSNMLDPD